jgi:hypothetical protein
MYLCEKHHSDCFQPSPIRTDRQIRLAKDSEYKGLPGWRTKGAAASHSSSALLLQCPNLPPSPWPSSPPLFFVVVPSREGPHLQSFLWHHQNVSKCATPISRTAPLLKCMFQHAVFCFPFLHILLHRSDCNGSTSQKWSITGRDASTTITLADPNLQVQFCLDAKTSECFQCFNEIS